MFMKYRLDDEPQSNRSLGLCSTVLYAIPSWFTCVSQRWATPALTFVSPAHCRWFSSCLEAVEDRLAASVELSRSGTLGADSRRAAEPAAKYVAAGGPADSSRPKSAAPSHAEAVE